MNHKRILRRWGSKVVPGERARASILAIALVLTVVAAPIAMAAIGDELDTTDDNYQGVHIHEDTLTVAEHDRGEMDSLVSYNDDDGEVAELEAAVNSTQDEPVGVNFAKIEDGSYNLFPRVDGESGNMYSWTDEGNWTTGGANSSKISVVDGDGNTASGVSGVNINTDGSMAAGDVAAGVFKQNVSVTSDVSKRVLFLAVSINDLSGDGEVRVQDADGDYFVANMSTSDNSRDSDVIANSSDAGIVYQVKLNDLQVNDNGSSNADGTVDAIKRVEIVALDGELDVDVVGLDVETKSILDLGTRMRDTDGDGDEEEETFQEVNGENATAVIQLTGLDTMGAWADNAKIMDLEVNNVKYRAQDLGDADDYDIVWDNASDYPQFDVILNQSVRLSAPSKIDLSHGTLTLRMEQSLVEDRYIVVEYATATGSTDLRNVTDSDFTDDTSSFNSEGSDVDLTTVSAGDNNVIHFRIKYVDDERESLDATSSGGGAAPVEDSGGGLLGFSPVQWVISVFVALGGFLGLRRFGIVG